MSKKITFQELIESIAEESGRTKQFTHDFLKDFVAIVNDRLQEKDSVNIAPFGKFKLREMDEREGVNPQTGEKITIPAHHKAVFKPYKKLRELVNAPYDHLEPELLDEDGGEEKKLSDEQAEASSGEEEPFIPTAPPPSVESKSEEAQNQDDEESESAEVHPFIAERTSDAADHDETDSESEIGNNEAIGRSAGDSDDQINEEDADPFNFNEEDGQEASPFDLEETTEEDTEGKSYDAGSDLDEQQEGYDDDIVEFTHDAGFSGQDNEGEDIDAGSQEEEAPFDLEDDPFEADTDSEEYEMYPLPGDEEELENEEDEAEEEVSLNDAFREQDEQPEEEEQAYEAPVFKDRSIRKNRNTGGNMWIIAAAVIVILLAGGSWFLLGSGGGQTSGSSDAVSSSASKQATSKTVVSTTPQQSDQPGNQNTGAGNNAKAKSGKTGAEAATASSKSSATSTAKASTGNEKIISHTVEAGETLWSLADINYRDPYRWPWIYDENQPTIDNPNLIKVGQRLDIPMPQGNNGSLSNNDSLQVAIAFAETYSWYKERKMNEAKFYLYTAKKYHADVLDYIDIQVDDDDLAFANQK